MASTSRFAKMMATLSSIDKQIWPPDGMRGRIVRNQVVILEDLCLLLLILMFLFLAYQSNHPH